MPEKKLFFIRVLYKDKAHLRDDTAHDIENFKRNNNVDRASSFSAREENEKEYVVPERRGDRLIDTHFSESASGFVRGWPVYPFIGTREEVLQEVQNDLSLFKHKEGDLFVICEIPEEYIATYGEQYSRKIHLYLNQPYGDLDDVLDVPVEYHDGHFSIPSVAQIDRVDPILIERVRNRNTGSFGEGVVYDEYDSLNFEHLPWSIILRVTRINREGTLQSEFETVRELTGTLLEEAALDLPKVTVLGSELADEEMRVMIESRQWTPEQHALYARMSNYEVAAQRLTARKQEQYRDLKSEWRESQGKTSEGAPRGIEK